MPAQLLALNDGPSISLDKPILLIGRDMECDIRLDSRKISRRHCCIAQVGEFLVVRDLGSTNGIRINGIRALEGKLKTGDELTIGNFRYRVRWDELDPPSDSSKVAKSDPRVGAREKTDRPPNEDDLLESCDEPIPLSDPHRPPAPIAKKLVQPPASVPIVLEVAPAAPDSVPPARPKQILPEDLDLVPPSEIIELPQPPIS